MTAMVSAYPWTGEVVANLLAEFGELLDKACIGRFANFLKRDAIRGALEVAQQVLRTLSVLEVEPCQESGPLDGFRRSLVRAQRRPFERRGRFLWPAPDGANLA